MKIRQEEELITHIPLIDKEHLSIIVEFNELENLLKEMNIDVYYSILVNFLEKYIEVHFRHEEALQEKSQYPDRKLHKSYHDQLRMVVLNSISKFSHQDITIKEVESLHSFVGSWIYNHIKNEDVAIW